MAEYYNELNCISMKAHALTATEVLLLYVDQLGTSTIHCTRWSPQKWESIQIRRDEKYRVHDVREIGEKVWKNH